ncbi:MAG: 16S rRNA (cytidine(1402)-2'-O)-methyltransferase [Phascolarctobacterium sp.]|nr:16S rRNA (cytidine(1402)-2'-O)-methyltransferase [Candidatus Phascolarctobacterium equi]
MAQGTLYLIGTPIGNLGDMTPRGLELLKTADVVAAEDTRHTLELLNHFDIKNKLVRYDEHTKDAQGEVLLKEMRSGKNVALVSDAGLPGIADPGADLAERCIAENIQVVPVPGANAALTALIASGLPTQPFFFGGFLPKSAKNRKEQLELWKNVPATMVFYEAPHRIKEVLGDVLKVWGNRKICLARELTKLHEEFWRGDLAGALEHLQSQDNIRGEFVIILAPPVVEVVEYDLETLVGKVQELIAQGVEKKEALSYIAKEFKVPKRELYNRLLNQE